MIRSCTYTIVVMTAVLSLAAACTRIGTDTSDSVKAIEFSSAVTKAQIYSVSQLQTEGIGVYALEHSRSDERGVLFDNQALAYNSTAGAWQYSPVRYWTPGSEYVFWGLYPRAARSFNMSNGNITIDNFRAAYSYNGQTDLLAACAYRSFQKSADGTTVNLAMNHILSSLVVRIRNSSTDGAVTISNVSLTGMYDQGSCVLSPVSGKSEFVTTWTPSNLTTMTCAGDIPLNNIPTSSTVYDLYREPILVIPQTVLSTMTLNFSVSWGGGSPTVKTLALTRAPEIKKWEPGKKYTYVASITDSNITFSLIVNDWIDDSEIEMQ